MKQSNFQKFCQNHWTLLHGQLIATGLRMASILSIVPILYWHHSESATDFVKNASFEMVAAVKPTVSDHFFFICWGVGV
jgi:hypothetical protein